MRSNDSSIGQLTQKLIPKPFDYLTVHSGAYIKLLTEIWFAQ